MNFPGNGGHDPSHSEDKIEATQQRQWPFEMQGLFLEQGLLVHHEARDDKDHPQPHVLLTGKNQKQGEQRRNSFTIS